MTSEDPTGPRLYAITYIAISSPSNGIPAWLIFFCKSIIYVKILKLPSEANIQDFSIRQYETSINLEIIKVLYDVKSICLLCEDVSLLSVWFNKELNGQ